MAKQIIVEHYERELTDRLRTKVKQANRMLLEDIHRTANHTTPFLDGDLRQLVTKTTAGLRGTIVWTVPYAQYQERGRRRYPPYHEVKHYTTPGTSKGFAKRAVKKVMYDTRRLKRYINFGSTYRP